jgi:putative sterol carrier protein
MRSAFGVGADGGHTATYEFRIEGEAFHLRVGEGIEARQGQAPDPDLVIIGDAETFLAVASGKLGPEEAVRSGALRVEGERGEEREAFLRWCQYQIGMPAV